MGGVRFHPEVLGERQAGVLDATAPVLAGRGFHLGGGTGLALVLGHRRSDDFDWFSREPLGDAQRLARALREEGIAFETGRVARGTLHGTVDGIPVSLLEFAYPLLADPIAWPQRGASILSLDDIACMKLSAIAQRGARKDFVDLHALVTAHRPLSELVELYRRKFEVGEIGHLLYSLAWFDDAEAERMPVMLAEVEWSEIRGAIEGWVRELAEG